MIPGSLRRCSEAPWPPGRCEKAAKIGIERVYQLEGGIFKYFEEVGGAGASLRG